MDFVFLTSFLNIYLINEMWLVVPFYFYSVREEKTYKVLHRNVSCTYWG